MKVVILSTESPHHTYFINKISEQFNVAAVFYETKHVTPKFAISPFFDEEETDFEKRYFFQAVSNQINDSLPVHYVQTVNDHGVSDALSPGMTDVITTFSCSFHHATAKVSADLSF